MKSSVQKLCYMALLTAIALTIFLLEAQIPIPIPVPGIKLGLSNIITLCALYLMGPGDALCILLARVFLGSVFSGQIMTLFYSLGGGLLCWLAMVLVRHILSPRQIWVCSIVGAVFHNVGQILVAMAITGTPSIAVYFPVLLISGIVTGLFTGLCAQYLIPRLEKIEPFRKK